MLGVAVIGLGVMGLRHVEAFRALPGCAIVAGHDIDPVARRRAEAVESFDDLDEAIDRAELVIVATPSSTHADVTRHALAAGKHVLVEKPLAPSAEEAAEMVAAARRHGVALMIGMSERFNPVVRELARRIAGHEVRTITCDRHGPAPKSCADVDIVTELAVHDLDLIAHLTGSPLAHVRTRLEGDEATRLDATTENGIHARVHASWRNGHRTRRIGITTDREQLSADLLLTEGRDRPLRAQAAATLARIQGEPSFIASGDEGVRLLEAIERGRPAARAPAYRHMPIESP